MSNKYKNSSAPKLLKSIRTNRSYSGIGNTSFLLQKPKSSQSPRFTQLKRNDDRSASFMQQNHDLPIHYHPWKLEYSQTFVRDKSKKCMIKDSYTSYKHLVPHAEECITTEQECSPVLIPASEVRIEQPIIRLSRKPFVPSIVRYLRKNELLPSERDSRQNFTISELQFETKVSIPMIGDNKTCSLPSILPVSVRLLNRANMRDDPGVIRRPPRRLILSAAQKITVPLRVYG